MGAVFAEKFNRTITDLLKEVVFERGDAPKDLFLEYRLFFLFEKSVEILIKNSVARSVPIKLGDLFEPMRIFSKEFEIV